MAELRILELTNEDLQAHMNTCIELLAHEMVKDGLVSNAEDITNRYLAIVTTRSKAARMFASLFDKSDTDKHGAYVVIRVDRNKNA